jgi:hypothetical protein
MEADLAIRALYDELKSIRAVSRKLGINRAAVKKIVENTKAVYTGTVSERQHLTAELPPEGYKKIYLLTCAQNNTLVNESFWNNLLAYREWLTSFNDTSSVELLVSRFTYNKTDSQEARSKKKQTQDHTAIGPTFDSRIAEYAFDSQIELAPSLVFCAEANIIPTAARPLSGFETYTGRNSGIFPHVKLALESVPQMEGTGAKFNYTTGTVTRRNYIQRKEGLKAEFHHVYGALIVEVDSDGAWYVRQLSADNDGTFFDLDRLVSKGRVEAGHAVEAITWGDVHLASADFEQIELNWGSGGIIDQLKPNHQFLHDVLDFKSRNHHDTKNPHRNFKKWVHGDDDVEQECLDVANFLAEIAARDFCKTHVVASNHDNALERWLNEGDYRSDPRNALFFLEQQLAYYKAMAEGEEHHVFEHAMQQMGVSIDVHFMREDESFVLCPSHGGIECGLHGHLGSDGARGTPSNLSRMGRRANTCHTHSTRILDGLYVAGTCAMKPDYKRGPSSWSYSHVITYSNGKRAIITVYDGKWKA